MKHKINIYYDAAADVLYINFFTPPECADHGEIDEHGNLCRYKEGNLIGVTILNFKDKHMKGAKDAK